METAKVDIRRLQMLNDRINQTLDALNQVRLSVHGISHTGMNAFAANPWAAASYSVPGAGVPGVLGGHPYAQQLAGIVPGLSHSSQFGSVNPYAQNPYAQNPYAQQLAGIMGIVPGLSHSSQFGSVNPYAQNPYAQNPYAQNPYAQNPYAQNPYAQNPYAQNPYAQQLAGIAPGLSHLSPFAAANPYAQQLAGIVPGLSHSSQFGSVNPYAYGAINSLISPLLGNPLGLAGGLAHTSPEALDPSSYARSALGVDPFYGQRILQTFPFAQWGYSPLSSGLM